MKNSDKQNRLTRTFVPNSRIYLTLPPIGGKVLSGNLILTGTVTLAAGTANGTVVGEGGPINLIRRVKVRANPAGGSRYPGGRIVDASPRSLLRFATFMHEGRFIGELFGSTLGGGANGAYQIYVSIPIYWADPTKRRSVETALNADPAAYELIQIEIDTADVTACFSGNNANVTYDLQVQWQDDRENFAGDTIVLFQEDHVRQIPASNTRMLDEGMPRDGAFLDWTILSEQSTDYTLADTLLNKLTLDGPAITYEKYSDDILAQMLFDGWLNPAQSGTGVRYIDFTDGLLTGAVDAATLQANFDVNNVSGANEDDLLIFTRRAFYPAGYQPQYGPGAGKNS